MTLEEKLLNISTPPLADIAGVGLLPSGTEDTIEAFFDNFIKPRLPKKNIVKEWHRQLMDYTAEANWPELSCCVRFGNNGSKKQSKWGESGYYKLRRGWLTKNKTDNFEYFFADNSFPAFIYKLALDGFVPSGADELRKVFRQRKFPYSFGFFIDNSKNEFKGVTVNKGVNPGFLGNYKLSHIFDAGEYFNINGQKLGDAKLSDDFYPIGHSDDFLTRPDRIREMPIGDDAKEIIVAKFLRFAHPFNYFLTPTKKHHICGQKVYKKDIGEDPRMISYVRAYLKATYPTEYAEFLQRIMWYDEPDASPVTGAERIDIVYGPDIISKSKTSKKAVVAKGYTDDERIGVAAYYLRHNEGLKQVEVNHLHLTERHGATAKHILNKLGVDTSRNTPHKGLLLHADIDEEIEKATGTFKLTLEAIKKATTAGALTKAK